MITAMSINITGNSFEHFCAIVVCAAVGAIIFGAVWLISFVISYGQDTGFFARVAELSWLLVGAGAIIGGALAIAFLP